MDHTYRVTELVGSSPDSIDQAIRNAIDDLDKGTMHLAELRTNSALASLKGKTMDSVEVGEGPEAPHRERCLLP